MRLARFLYQHLRLCGIGIVFLALPAVAKIVYTPVNVAIAGNGRISIDLNHDGIVDFTIAANEGGGWCVYDNTSLIYGLATLFPATGNGVVAGHGTVAPLPSGTLVSGSDTFQTQAQIERFHLARALHGGPPQGCVSGSQGWCVNSTGFCNATAFMGLAFKINGQIHYGWAYLSIYVSPFSTIFKATLKGFAFETVAGQGIMTGATSGP